MEKWNNELAGSQRSWRNITGAYAHYHCSFLTFKVVCNSCLIRANARQSVTLAQQFYAKLLVMLLIIDVQQQNL